MWLVCLGYYAVSIYLYRRPKYRISTPSKPTASSFFFLKDPAPPEISPLPLPAALPLPGQHAARRGAHGAGVLGARRRHAEAREGLLARAEVAPAVVNDSNHRLASPSAAARTATIAI